MRIGYVAAFVAVCVLAVSALLLQQRVSHADGHECPSSWPAQSYEGLHTDDRGKSWFIIRSADSNGYESVRAYVADDAYSAGYATGSPDEICYLIVRRPGDTADAAEPNRVVFQKEREDRRSSAPVPRTDDAITREYVMNAIAHYEQRGRAATVEYYNTEASVKAGRALILVDTADDNRLLAYGDNPALVGESVTGRISLFLPDIGEIIENATATGTWTTMSVRNEYTGAPERLRLFAVLRQDGLAFISSHRDLTEDTRDTLKGYVNRAIERYDNEGLQATIDYYNRLDSREGQFYLFLIGADDNYLAHPIFPHLIGTDIKAVVGSDGQELGKEIAQATSEGIWVEYLWPHPVSRKELPKVTWAIRHDGLIFASGYYIGGSERSQFELPAWANVADPQDYTERYVERAIEHYKQHGLESLKRYYNSTAAYEGQWYLFATDADDIYIVHPLIPRLIGTDINDVVGDDGFELGKALAAAQNGGPGVSVEYDWPHPLTLKKVPKVGYAKRYDGLLFASGYYPTPDDLAAQAKAYVQQAIDYYDANGLDDTIVKYNNPDSIGGHLSAMIIDEQGIVRVFPLQPNLKGIPVSFLVSPDGQKVGEEFLAATEDGIWVSFYFPPSVGGSGSDYQHGWLRRHHGLIFGVGYSDYQEDVPDAAKIEDQLTRKYVMDSIAYYKANGREATIEYYSLVTEDRAVPSLGLDGRYLFLVDPANYVLLASPILHMNNQVFGPVAPGGPFHAQAAQADENGIWVQSLRPNPRTGQQEPVRNFIVLHDGLLFISSHQIIQENVEAATKEYVKKAIAYYENRGLAATVRYYNSRASLDGQFYLFMMDKNDIYLVHPIQPERIGTDIKEVTDGAGDPLGRRIAQATKEGIWVEYFWPHPVTGEKELKTTWAIRHDGKIFASGYYTASPAWVGEDPWEFTQDYVGRAIERYNDAGLESMKNYYNSVVSFEGQWYLFATDENDIYIVHPIFPHLRGTDIKALPGKDSEGNPLGESLAKATDGEEGGIRVEYQWPHPITEVEAPKIAYAVRRDGILFASGYYPLPEDPRKYTQDYVAEAIAYYDEHGQEATVEYYGSKESVEKGEGVWFLALLDKDGKFLTHYVYPGLVGTNAADYWSPDGTDVGNKMLASTEEGHWFQATFPNIRGAGDNHRITWSIRHKGLVFASGYFGAPTGDPTGPGR